MNDKSKAIAEITKDSIKQVLNAVAISKMTFVKSANMFVLTIPNMISTIKKETRTMTIPLLAPLISAVLNVICKAKKQPMRINTQNNGLCIYASSILNALVNTFPIFAPIVPCLTALDSKLIIFGTNKQDIPYKSTEITTMGATPIKKLPAR